MATEYNLDLCFYTVYFIKIGSVVCLRYKQGCETTKDAEKQKIKFVVNFNQNYNFTFGCNPESNLFVYFSN